MNGITTEQLKSNAPGPVQGNFTQFFGDRFYKIQNFDAMPPFFMTIVSSSDIWNYIWSNGGLTAGRKNANYAVFPYYTADKVSDSRSHTGPYTAILIPKSTGTLIWEPFCEASNGFWKIERNLYKNTSGSKLYFEEINENLGLTFQYGWTSSDLLGLVRHARILNNSKTPITLSVLDGCQNILPACVTSDFQNDNSVLLDAYKKTDLDLETGMAIFSVTSIVTDKAEPNEGLLANTSWFNCEGSLHLSPDTPAKFRKGLSLSKETVLKGQRPSFFIQRSFTLTDSNEWYQVFDTSLELGKISELKVLLKDRAAITATLERDIQIGIELLETYIKRADGFQNTADTETCVHHEANVLFNIMRGGIFADADGIDLTDFLNFASTRNKRLGLLLKDLLKDLPKTISFNDLEKNVYAFKNPQLERMLHEYLPLTFSRRHGDPSRPWNRFSIELKDEKGNPKLNYQGNWRDIFQNWEALCFSWPVYLKNCIAKFLNAVTPDGFNPYRLTRDGIDWEVQEPDNPWSNIGYWGDHQIIYLSKLMELQYKIDKNSLLESLDSRAFSSGNVPYRLKSHEEILANPHSTIIFDSDLHEKIIEKEAVEGTDARLLHSLNGEVTLVSMTCKILNLVLAKIASFVPGGGIWLNTQRPEWNDANNALAGYGLSMVTLYYLRRFMSFLLTLYQESPIESFNIPEETATFLKSIISVYEKSTPESLFSPKTRRTCVDSTGLLFQKQRESLYKNGFSEALTPVSKTELITGFTLFLTHIDATLTKNKRPDGLFHSYNTLEILEDGGIEVHTLDEMLEGQVAVLSSGFLSPKDAIDLCKQLRKSSLYRSDQNSYILYPEKTLPLFIRKNSINFSEIKKDPLLIKHLGTNKHQILYKDSTGDCHFNPLFRNAKILEKAIVDYNANAVGTENQQITAEETFALKSLYEKTFNHRSFTGRSGTFYAYEGLGSIYWHMVSKLLLAVQENFLVATSESDKKELAELYYDVRNGIGFNKTPEEYGAFPTDPYSHTPSGQGAKQPGMTGQVKEEIITRWGEFGITLREGIISFKPGLLKRSEFHSDGTLEFSWCDTPIHYLLESTKKTHESVFISPESVFKITCEGPNGSINVEGASLSKEDSTNILLRNAKISKVLVYIRD